jgi:hypothetical protein
VWFVLKAGIKVIKQERRWMLEVRTITWHFIRNASKVQSEIQQWWVMQLNLNNDIVLLPYFRVLWHVDLIGRPVCKSFSESCLLSPRAVPIFIFSLSNPWITVPLLVLEIYMGQKMSERSLYNPNRFLPQPMIQWVNSVFYHSMWFPGKIFLCLN